MVKKSKKSDDRRSGLERRGLPPNCRQPCEPIVKVIEKRDASWKESLVKLESEVHAKLDKIFTCLGTKIPSKLFWKLISAGAFFIFVVIGGSVAGTLWSLRSTIADIATDVKVMSVSVKLTANQMNQHVTRAEMKYDEFDKRLDSIERGETYFNFHDRDYLLKKPRPEDKQGEDR